ncbi:MAG: hypothetical protein R2744_08040 [Bacteroidales bacterium]
MRLFIRICAIVAGTLFMFSGLVKGIDPLGSEYKFIDYFTAFGLDSLNNIALLLGILLSAAEFIIGFSVFYWYQGKGSSMGNPSVHVILYPSDTAACTQ